MYLCYYFIFNTEYDWKRLVKHIRAFTFYYLGEVGPLSHKPLMIYFILNVVEPECRMYQT